MQHPEFPLSDELIYLNHAAVGPWPQRTSQAVSLFAAQNTLYGSVHYADWLQQETELREQLQILLNAPAADDIALVKNTSEALSLVAFGLPWQAGDNIVSSNQEFPSNRVPWQALASQGVEFRQADLNAAATPEDALFALTDRRTRLLTISSIQFGSGLRMDLERIGAFCAARDILFCVDAIQSLGAVQFDVQRYRADFVMADGHKWLLGPEGLGVFYSRPGARERLKLNQYGWHMLKDVHDYRNTQWEIHPTARRFECGSPNMLGIHALSASLSLLLETGMANVEDDIMDNAGRLRQQIMTDQRLELLSSNQVTRQSGIVVFRHRHLDTETLYRHLQNHNVICAPRGGGIRFSPHFYHTPAELDRVREVLALL